MGPAESRHPIPAIWDAVENLGDLPAQAQSDIPGGTQSVDSRCQEPRPGAAVPDPGSGSSDASPICETKAAEGNLSIQRNSRSSESPLVAAVPWMGVLTDSDDEVEACSGGRSTPGKR